MTGERPTTERQRKAQSEILGVVLILGVTMLSISAILLMGYPVMGDAEEMAHIERAENELKLLSNELIQATRGFGEANANLDIDEGRLEITPDASNVTVTYTNHTDNRHAAKDEVSTGELTYRNGDATVTFKHGSLITSYGSRNTRLAGTPQIYRDRNHLSMYIYNFTDAVTITGATRSFSISTHNRTSDFNVPEQNPLLFGELSVEMETDHPVLWRRYLESIGAHQSTNTSTHVETTLHTGTETFGQAILANSSLSLQTNLIDAYDSRFASYSDQSPMPHGHVVTGDDSLTSPPLPNNAIKGDVYSTTSFDTNLIQGDYIELKEPPYTPNIDDEIIELIQTLRPRAEAITTPTPPQPFNATNNQTYIIQGTASPELDFDTTAGSINVIIDGDVTVEGSDMNITGPNPVTFYVTDQASIHFQTGDVKSKTERILLRVIGHSNSDIDITTPQEFHGAIYSPGGAVTVAPTEFYGAIEANDVTVDVNEFHYDMGLVDADPGLGSERISSFDMVKTTLDIR